MMRLKMGVHTVSGLAMVEVWDENGKFVAAIYPTDDGVRIVSKSFVPDEPKLVFEDMDFAGVLGVDFR